MKISKKFKNVNYFGLTLTVEKTAKFLATDADGTIYSFTVEPEISRIQKVVWVGKGTEWIAEVDLEGLNWQETLVELK